MPLGTFIAGQYAGVYGAAALGTLEKGWRLRWQFHKEVIADTDAYGQTPIDSIYRGASVWIGGVFMETKAGVIAVTSPYNSYAPTGASAFELGIIGRLDTGVAGALVLTAIAGTPAASSPTSLTATLAIQEEDQVEQQWGPTLRKTPFMMRCLPYLSTTVRFFSTS